MHNSYYKVDIRYSMASTKANGEALLKFKDYNGVPQSEIDEYVGSRILTWYETFKCNHSLYLETCEIVIGNVDVKKLYEDTLDRIYSLINDNNDYVILLLELGVLIRIDDEE